MKSIFKTTVVVVRKFLLQLYVAKIYGFKFIYYFCCFPQFFISNYFVYRPTVNVFWQHFVEHRARFTSLEVQKQFGVFFSLVHITNSSKKIDRTKLVVGERHNSRCAVVHKVHENVIIWSAGYYSPRTSSLSGIINR